MYSEYLLSGMSRNKLYTLTSTYKALCGSCDYKYVRMCKHPLPADDLDCIETMLLTVSWSFRYF